MTFTAAEVTNQQKCWSIVQQTVTHQQRTDWGVRHRAARRPEARNRQDCLPVSPCTLVPFVSCQFLNRLCSLSITARGLPVSQGRILRLVSGMRGLVITRIFSELFDTSVQVSRNINNTEITKHKHQKRAA